jgi:hypothetical protein
VDLKLSVCFLSASSLRSLKVSACKSKLELMRYSVRRRIIYWCTVSRVPTIAINNSPVIAKNSRRTMLAELQPQHAAEPRGSSEVSTRPPACKANFHWSYGSPTLPRPCLSSLRTSAKGISLGQICSRSSAGTQPLFPRISLVHATTKRAETVILLETTTPLQYSRQMNMNTVQFNCAIEPEWGHRLTVHDDDYANAVVPTRETSKQISPPPARLRC